MKTQNLKLLQLARENATATKPVRAEVNGTEATVYLHGVIGGLWGEVDETEFVKALSAITTDVIHLRIDSPGGDVFAARAMMTAVSQHQAKVIAHVDGLAASAATGICMACDEVEITQGAGFMIHNAWTVAIGNAHDMEETAALLAKLDAGLANDYARRSGKTVDEVRALMDAETWFTADEAVEAGFADRVVEVVQKRSSNTWNLSAYQHAPDPVPAGGAAEAAAVELSAQAAVRRAHAERLFRIFESKSA